MGVAKDCDAVSGTSACWQCRRSKIKCDKQRPCGSCVKRGRPHECSTFDGEMEQSNDELEDDAPEEKQVEVKEEN
ncbi:hypothetical protein GUITHDRAFT_82615, partial [Guillardia theta CCMP2712]